MSYQIISGSQYDYKGDLIPNKETLVHRILTTAAKTFGGCSITPLVGSWEHQEGPRKGEVVIEESICVTLHTDDVHQVHLFADYVKNCFNQESVILTEITNQKTLFV